MAAPTKKVMNSNVVFGDEAGPKKVMAMGRIYMTLPAAAGSSGVIHALAGQGGLAGLGGLAGRRGGMAG